MGSDQPPTSRYPFEPRLAIAGSRGELVFTKESCVYCTVCAKKCPTGALTVIALKTLGASIGCVHQLRRLCGSLPEELPRALNPARRSCRHARSRMALACSPI